MKQRQTPAWILIYSELFGLLYFLHPFVNLIRIYWEVPQARLGFWKIFCCCSVIKMCPTLWDPMDCSTPGLPDLLYLPEFAQTHVSWVGDVIQPSHLLLPPSPPALNLCQNQGLFQWVFPSGGQSTGASTSASVLPMNIQGWFPLELTGWIFLQSKRLSRVFSSTRIWKHQFFSTQHFLWSNFHIHTWLLEKP